MAFWHTQIYSVTMYFNIDKLRDISLTSIPI